MHRLEDILQAQFNVPRAHEKYLGTLLQHLFEP